MMLFARRNISGKEMEKPWVYLGNESIPDGSQFDSFSTTYPHLRAPATPTPFSSPVAHKLKWVSELSGWLIKHRLLDPVPATEFLIQ